MCNSYGVKNTYYNMFNVPLNSIFFKFKELINCNKQKK